MVSLDIFVCRAYPASLPVQRACYACAKSQIVLVPLLAPFLCIAHHRRDRMCSLSSRAVPCPAQRGEAIPSTRSRKRARRRKCDPDALDRANQTNGRSKSRTNTCAPCRASTTPTPTQAGPLTCPCPAAPRGSARRFWRICRGWLPVGSRHCVRGLPPSLRAGRGCVYRVPLTGITLGRPLRRRVGGRVSLGPEESDCCTLEQAWGGAASVSDVRAAWLAADRPSFFRSQRSKKKARLRFTNIY
jgi:hypothetical protein